MMRFGQTYSALPAKGIAFRNKQSVFLILRRKKSGQA